MIIVCQVFSAAAGKVNIHPDVFVLCVNHPIPVDWFQTSCSLPTGPSLSIKLAAMCSILCHWNVLVHAPSAMTMTINKCATAQASYNTVQLRRVSSLSHTISNRLATVTDQMLPLHVKSVYSSTGQ